MIVTEKIYYDNLNRLYTNAKTLKVDSRSKIVIFSDLHMGDHSSSDDFKANASLFNSSLEKYYLKRNYTLILNGDVEELQRFKLQKITSSWPDTFKLFNSFNKRKKLYKTIGNHDLSLAVKTDDYPFELYDALRLQYKKNNILILHGHQASGKYTKNNDLVGFSLKYLATPLGIKNFSVAHNSRKKYKIEKRLYRFSNYKKIVSIIGHTHRPLFESMPKFQRLKMKIDQLCREMSQTSNIKQIENIQQSILYYKLELKKIRNQIDNSLGLTSLYHQTFHIPSLFNSGTVIGKRGITCLEIEGGKISLIHWFDKTISKKYLHNSGYIPDALDNTQYYRMVINEEDLDYIFTKIELLA